MLHRPPAGWLDTAASSQNGSEKKKGALHGLPRVTDYTGRYARPGREDAQAA